MAVRRRSKTGRSSVAARPAPLFHHAPREAFSPYRRSPCGSILAASRAWTATLREAEADEPRRENMYELFQLLVDNVKDYAIFILGTDGRTLSWNAGVLRMLEYNEQEFVGLEFAALFRPGEQDAAAREMQIAAANG